MKFDETSLSTNRVSQLLAQGNTELIIRTLKHAPSDKVRKLFNQLSKDNAEEIFIYLDPYTQANIIQNLDQKTRIVLLDSMAPDDRAKLFEALPKDTAKRYLRRLSVKERRATSMLLEYPAETAGRIMSPFFIALHPAQTVQEALTNIRKQGADSETLYVLPVVDDDMHLLGIIELDQLVLAKPNQIIEELMDKNIKSFSVMADQEIVARFIQSTDWLAVPIVEKDSRLVGMVTIDDAMDIMQLEETEDIFRSSATGPLGKPYLSVPVLRLMKVRIIWLFLLAIAGTLTVNVLHAFETTINQVIVLTLFIPLLIGIGGNTGSQSATMIVRALAVEDIRIHDFLRVAGRETAVGLLLGLSLGIASYLLVWIIFSQPIALIVALSLLTICTIASLTGSLMPIIARALKLDPAVVSGPFISTLIDATGLLIYFLIANLVLPLH